VIGDVTKVANMAGQDTGGQAAKLTQAFNEFAPDCEMKSFSFSNPLGYPSTNFLKDVRETSEIPSFLSEADVIHVHNKFWYADYWFSKYKVKPRPNVAWVFHQHGRNHSLDFSSNMKQRRALHIVSTHNLLPYVSNDVSRWLPAPFDGRVFDNLLKNRDKLSKKDDIIRVCQSPTDRIRKETAKFISAMYEVEKINKKIELVIIENKNNEECLNIKSICDVCFDQIGLALGNSGIEGMFLGNPVVAGTSDIVRELVKKIYTIEPYVYATWDSLPSVLLELCSSPSVRKKWINIGSEYVRKFHDYPNNVKIVKNLYDAAVDLSVRSS